MTKNEIEFDDWFDNVALHVLDRTGFEFRDADSVRGDYEAGRDAYDVIDEIVAEYE